MRCSGYCDSCMGTCMRDEYEELEAKVHAEETPHRTRMRLAESEVTRLRLVLAMITDRSGYFLGTPDPWSHAVMRDAMLSIDSTARRALRTTDATKVEP